MESLGTWVPFLFGVVLLLVLLLSAVDGLRRVLKRSAKNKAILSEIYRDFLE